MTTAKPISQPKLRFARFSEIYSCAQVLAQSFAEDVLFGEYIHPHRHEYPDDMALFWYRPMLTEWFDWTMVFLVSTEMDKQGREIITGVALWHRMGDNGRRCGWGLAPWDPRQILTPISKLYTTLASNLSPNRAIEPSKSDILHRSEPFTKHIFTGPRSEHWYLHFLGVHPSHQNKGIGRHLVSWGLDQARRESVGACVVAAYKKDDFYSRCGFQEILGRSGQGEGNPLGEIPGGNIWWVDPVVDVDKDGK